MATVTKSRRVYVPTPAEIEAAKAELDAKRLAAFDALPTEEERLEAERLRSRRNRAAAKAAVEVDVEDVVNAMLHQNDESEPIDLDEHRDPRQTEQWLPVPTADDDEPKALNYYTINARPVARVLVGPDGPQEMSALDIANVELLTTDDLVECVSLPLDASDMQHRIDDLVGNWTLGPIDPELFDVRGYYDPRAAARRQRGDVIEFKPALKPTRFRSSL